MRDVLIYPKQQLEYTFTIITMGSTYMLLEPVGPLSVLVECQPLI